MQLYACGLVGLLCLYLVAGGRPTGGRLTEEKKRELWNTYKEQNRRR